MKHAPLIALFALACDDHPHDEPHGHGQAIELRFAAMVGDEAFTCAKSFGGLGTANSTLEAHDFRFYVHDVRLVTSDGDEVPVVLDADDLWQSEEVALLDFEDKTGTCTNGTPPMNDVVRGTYDVGHDAADFTGVKFRLGVPFALNHADASSAPSPLNLSGLYWGWQAGYKFMRLDLMVVGGVDDPRGASWRANVHLGSTGCAIDRATQRVSACTGMNRPEVALDGFDPATDVIALDLAALVAGVDLSQNPYPHAVGDASVGCMADKDDPECAVVFEHLGLDLESGEPKAGQSAFGIR